MKHRGVFVLGVGVALGVLAADQVSKWWVVSVLQLNARPALVLLPVLDLRLVANRGITFGWLGQSSFAGPLLLAVIALAIVVALGVWLRRTERPLIAVAIGAIVGGAIGNVADRLRLGFVVDFIQVHAFAWSWYVFNVADAAIVCGVGVLLLDGLFDGRGQGQRPADV